MTISPYQNSVSVFQFTPYLRNVELEAKVLMDKQGKYDNAYAGIQKLRQESLNINFLNQKEQGKVDTFNNDLNKLFDNLNGELGDLSNKNIVGKYTDMFNTIAKDTTLINRYKTDRSYQNQLRDVFKKRDSKDPVKSGYHAINHANFQRRLNDYSNADLDTDQVTVKPYSNYIDYNKEVRDIIKEVPTKEYTKDVRMGDGTIVTETYKEKDRSKVNAAVSSYLSTSAGAQLLEEAEYYYHNNLNDPSFKGELYTNSMGMLTSNKSKLEQAKKDLTSRLPFFKGAELAQASQTIAKYEQDIIDLDKQIIPFKEFSAKSNEQLVGAFSRLYHNDLTQSYSNTYGGILFASTKIRADEGFFKARNLELGFAELNVDAEYKNALISAKEDELNFEKLKYELGNVGGGSSVITNETVQAVATDKLAEHIIKNIVQLKIDNKDYLETGITQEDIVSGAIKLDIDTKVADLEARKNKLENELRLKKIEGIRHGTGVKQSIQLADELKEVNATLKIEKNRLNGESSTPLQLTAKAIENTKFFVNSVRKNAPDMLALQEVIEKYVLVNQLKNTKDIKPSQYPDILEAAKKIKITPGTRANSQYVKNTTAAVTADQMIEDAGITSTDTHEEGVKKFKQYIKLQDDIIPHLSVQRMDLDLTNASGDRKERVLNNVNKIKKFMVASSISNKHEFEGATALDPKSIQNNYFTSSTESATGTYTVTFNPKLMEEGQPLYNKYVKGLDGTSQLLTPNNPTIILQNNDYASFKFDDYYGNKISKHHNLEYTTPYGNYRAKISNDGSQYYITIGKEILTLPTSKFTEEAARGAAVNRLRDIKRAKDATRNNQ